MVGIHSEIGFHSCKCEVSVQQPIVIKEPLEANPEPILIFFHLSSDVQPHGFNLSMDYTILAFIWPYIIYNVCDHILTRVYLTSTQSIWHSSECFHKQLIFDFGFSGFNCLEKSIRCCFVVIQCKTEHMGWWSVNDMNSVLT